MPLPSLVKTTPDLITQVVEAHGTRSEPRLQPLYPTELELIPNLCLLLTSSCPFGGLKDVTGLLHHSELTEIAADSAVQATGERLLALLTWMIKQQTLQACFYCMCFSINACHVGLGSPHESDR